MSRTWKDRPYSLGGDRHKWCIVSNHGSHGKFTKLMRRLRRAFLKREVRDNPDEAATRTPYDRMYFD